MYAETATRGAPATVTDTGREEADAAAAVAREPCTESARVASRDNDPRSATPAVRSAAMVAAHAWPLAAASAATAASPPTTPPPAAVAYATGGGSVELGDDGGARRVPAAAAR